LFSGSGSALRFLLRRAVQALFVIFGVACVTFFVLRLVPGDPARLMVPPGSSEEVVQTIRQQLGTDRPILEQFGIFLSGLVHGDLGRSFRYERPVLDLVIEFLPATLALGIVTIVLASPRRRVRAGSSTACR
jgi:ABC-type dipeptide/oligopeptide/nickel transport system permease component